jgi:hypothetical protein
MVLVTAAVTLWVGAVRAQQTTSFTYQGRLTDGGAASQQQLRSAIHVVGCSLWRQFLYISPWDARLLVPHLNIASH